MKSKVGYPPFFIRRTWLRQLIYLELELLGITQRNSYVCPMRIFFKKFLSIIKWINQNPLTLLFKKRRILTLSDFLKTYKNDNHLKKVPYASAIGYVIYAMLCTNKISVLLLEWLIDLKATRDLFIGK